MDRLTRALAFDWAIDDAASDEIIRVPDGIVRRTPSLPHAWSANALRLERPTDLTLDEAAALAERHAAVPYLQLMVEDEGSAERLAAAGRSQGWEVDLEVLMALTSPPPASEDPRVREGTLEEVLDLMHTWMTLEPDDQGEDAIADVLARDRRRHALTRERLVVADHAGRAAAMATLRRGDDDVAQVEDVFVRPEARGHGLGRAVTAAATRTAYDEGFDLVFIIADDEDWPQRLYGRIGYEPIGRRASLHRRPGTTEG